MVNLREAMIHRRSVRTYREELISQELKQKIEEFADTVEAPFKTKMRFQFIDISTTEPGIRLGTYGVIRGATSYLCAVAKKEDRMEEDLGYVFEKIILYITSLGLGTCWLGGTFNKPGFGKALNLGEDEVVPVITPVGYAGEKRSILERVMATAVGARNRKDWSELFFDKDFSHPLHQDDAGRMKECLEMVRIAPSASNKQPWRIIWDENRYHFFVCRTPGYGKLLEYDIQRLDVGIAMCHFECMNQELGGSGKWINMNPGVACAGNVEYIISYEIGEG